MEEVNSGENVPKKNWGCIELGHCDMENVITERLCIWSPVRHHMGASSVTYLILMPCYLLRQTVLAARGWVLSGLDPVIKDLTFNNSAEFIIALTCPDGKSRYMTGCSRNSSLQKWATAVNSCLAEWVNTWDWWLFCWLLHIKRVGVNSSTPQIKTWKPGKLLSLVLWKSKAYCHTVV